MTKARGQRNQATRPRPASGGAGLPWWQRPVWAGGVLFLIAIALYSNTLSHGYAVDDPVVIYENSFTTQGISGIVPIFTKDSFAGRSGDAELLTGGRYRPLSIATFALEWEFFGRNPAIGHLGNVLFYGLTVLLVFWLVLSELAPGRIGVAWVTSLVFALHPVHTEVVANIKGRDEIFVLLFFLASLGLFLRGLRLGAARLTALSLIAFVLALFSKETAVALVPLFGLAAWICGRVGVTRAAVLTVPYAALTGLFLLLRASITGSPADPANLFLLSPYLDADPVDRISTLVLILGKYLGMAVWPAVLSHDYFYDQIPLTGPRDPRVWGSLVLQLLILGATAFGIARRQLFAFGGAVYVCALFVVSNLVVNTGAPMADRFLYIPSFGLALVVGVLASGVQALRTPPPRARIVGVIALGTLAVLATVRTVTRNFDWRDNRTLILADVRNSPNSANTQKEAGSVLVELAEEETDPAAKQALLENALGHVQRAIEIYPGYATAYLDLGTVYRLLGRTAEAEVAWAKYSSLRPGDPSQRLLPGLLANSYYSEGAAFLRNGDFPQAIDRFRSAVAHDDRDFRAYLGLGGALESLGEYGAAIEAYRQSLSIEPTQANGWFRLGEASQKAGRMEEARSAWEEVLRIQPDHPGALTRLR